MLNGKTGGGSVVLSGINMAAWPSERSISTCYRKHGWNNCFDSCTSPPPLVHPSHKSRAVYGSLYCLSPHSSDLSYSLAATIPIRYIAGRPHRPAIPITPSCPLMRRPGSLLDPGLHNQNSIRIPMAFTARSQHLRNRRVPIASSEVRSFYCTRDDHLLSITLVSTSTSA
jgi:hypothetical protein